VSRLPTIDEALARVLESVRSLEGENVVVAEAAGRVVVRDATAGVDLPPFDSSAMDGYAVRAGDTPGELRVTAHSAAGLPAGASLNPGEAFGISTGAVVPESADAVVPVELTELHGDTVTVEAVAPGDNVRPRGGDIRSGDVVVRAGRRLGPAQVGALAAAGIAAVECGRRPRVALLATGTELRPPGEPLAPGEIYESNTTLLSAQVRSAGGVPVVLDGVADDEHATRSALARGLEADVLITSGGVSVGPHDLVRAALDELGAVEVFWRVAVKPGKPVVFATHGATLVFGLPGNPVSSLVGFELFVRPALNALQGADAPGPAYEPGRLATPLRRGPDRDELVRARALPGDDGMLLEPVGGQASHMIARAAAADALVLVPRGEGELAPGSSVRFLRI
jgi:molybdopterin molybdotransferase